MSFLLKKWMKKENNNWVGLSDEEDEEIDKELIFEISFLKNIIDVFQNKIYDYLLTLYSDEYWLIGVDAKVPMLASDYNEIRSTETDWAAATDYEPPFRFMTTRRLYYEELHITLGRERRF